MAEFIDPRDGERYKTVRLRDGNEWFAENLRFVSADSIAAEATPSGRSQHPRYKPFDALLYGRLYGWHDAQISCPPGWAVPTVDEWRRMLDFYGGFLVGFDGRNSQKEASVDRLQEAGFCLMSGPFDVYGAARHWDHPRDLESAQFWSSSPKKLGLTQLNPFAGPPTHASYFLFGDCAVDDVDRIGLRMSVRCMRKSE